VSGLTWQNVLAGSGSRGKNQRMTFADLPIGVREVYKKVDREMACNEGDKHEVVFFGRHVQYEVEPLTEPQAENPS
jgi:hypothetical protein